MRPVTTLFLLQSLDGKISAGPDDTDDLELRIPREELQCYYDLEQQTDEWSFITGRVMAKMIDFVGLDVTVHVPITLVISDTSHLNSSHLDVLCKKFKRVIVWTGNPMHPALHLELPNLRAFFGQREWLASLFAILAGGPLDCERLTIQSGGTVNSELFKQGLIDYVTVVIAPYIVGGATTPTLVDGVPTWTKLSLQSVEALDNGYIMVRYKVLR